MVAIDIQPGRIRPQTASARAGRPSTAGSSRSRRGPASPEKRRPSTAGRLPAQSRRVLRREEDLEFLRYKDKLTKTMRKLTNIAQAKYEKDKVHDWNVARMKILKANNITPSLKKTKRPNMAQRDPLKTTINLSKYSTKKRPMSAPATRRPPSFQFVPRATTVNFKKSSGRPMSAFPRTGRGSPGRPGSPLSPGSPGSPGGSPTKRPTSAPAVKHTQYIPERTHTLFEQVDHLDHVAIAKDENHSMTVEDKVLIREKNIEMEKAREGRLGKIESMKRSNARKKDRNFRFKLAHAKMLEGEKLLKTASAKNDKHQWLIAADCFTDALYLEPNLPVAHEKRGACWKGRKEYPLALADLCQAILKENTPNAAYYATRAGIFLNLGNYERSLKDLNMSCKLNRTNPHTFYNRSVILSEHTTPPVYEGALRDLNHALKLMEASMVHKLKVLGVSDTAVLNDSPVSFKVLHMAKEKGGPFNDTQKDSHFIFKVRLNRGDIARKLKLYDIALVDLKEAASLDVQSAVTWNLLGMTHYSTKSFTEAEKCFTNAIEILGEVPSYFYWRGLSRLMVHKTRGKDEVELLGNFLQDSIDDLNTAIHLQISLEEELEEDTEYRDVTEELVKLKKERASFHNGLSMSCLARGNENMNIKANEHVEIALSIDPGDHNFLHQSGLCHLAMNDRKKAFQRFNTAISLSPNFCPSLLNVSRIYHSTGNLTRAEDNLNKCIELGNADIDASETYRERGLVYFEKNMLSESERDFTKALELAMSNEIDNYFYRGESKRCLGDYKGALEDFAVVEAEGAGSAIIESGRYRFSRGVCLAQIGDLTNGLKDLTLACELSPEEARYISYRADVLAQLGLFREAEEALAEAVAVQKKINSSGLWSLLRKLSVAQFKQGNFATAEKSFHKALLQSKRATDHLEVADLYYKRGVCLAHLKKYSRAYTNFDKALSYDVICHRPERILYHHERAKAAQMCKKHHEAVEDFSTVIKLAPDDHRAIFRRGWSYKSLGLFLLAAEDFEKARALQPECKLYKLNYRAIGNVECIVLGKPGEEIIPLNLLDEFQRHTAQSEGL
ncbi:hypothetical protein TrVE_jg14332 [Triparma verrucosa]|uniref:Uncharacterized protein n=1 Tax=Triparma verrucosa TaxID=1606542 RepID=A0A9W7EUP9_9STRA|nr:hypothetical protein TrVE_jg14332 [Triparma verrucosa]